MSIFGIILLAVAIKFIIATVNAARNPRSWPKEPASFRCLREGCGAINPSSAVYCRRCGERARGSPIFHEAMEERKRE